MNVCSVSIFFHFENCICSKKDWIPQVHEIVMITNSNSEEEKCWESSTKLTIWTFWTGSIPPFTISLPMSWGEQNFWNSIGQNIPLYCKLSSLSTGHKMLIKENGASSKFEQQTKVQKKADLLCLDAWSTLNLWCCSLTFLNSPEPLHFSWLFVVSPFSFFSRNQEIDTSCIKR